MAAAPEVDPKLVSNGLDEKVGSFPPGTDLAPLQAPSSAGGASLHIMDEAAYLNPATVASGADAERFETRTEALGTLEDGTRQYDLIVIGSGSGIGRIASPACRLGYSVALVERARLGGTCLNRGCIPSKMLIHPAEVADSLLHAGRYHIKVDSWSMDTEALVRETSGFTDGESFGIDGALAARPKLDWYHGSARFVSAQVLEVNGKERVTAPRIFVAAGSRPFVPPIPGLAGTPYLTSTEALRVISKPKSLIVIGGGFISCELAFYFGATGWDMTVLSRSDLLVRTDASVQAEFQRLFLERFPKTQLSCSPTAVSYDEASKQFTVQTEYADGRTQSFSSSHLLVATGVRSNCDLLGVAEIGLKTKRGGYLEVDACLRTSVPGIWALGESAGNWLFRHSANFEGQYLFQHILHAEAHSPGGRGSLVGKETYPPIDYAGMAYAVFTGNEMQIGSVGMTEADARDSGQRYFVGLNTYRQCAYGDALRSRSGFCKLIVAEDRTILGAHIIGYQASVLLHQITVLFRVPGGAKLDYLLDTIYVHPALPELVRNAARKARAALLEGGVEVPPTLLYC